MATSEDERGPLTLRWFGDPWGSEINNIAPRDPTPEGQPCYGCKHAIQQGDQGVTLIVGEMGGEGSRQPMHIHCFVVSSIGGATQLRSLLGESGTEP